MSRSVTERYKKVVGKSMTWSARNLLPETGQAPPGAISSERQLIVLSLYVAC